MSKIKDYTALGISLVCGSGHLWLQTKADLVMELEAQLVSRIVNIDKDTIRNNREVSTVEKQAHIISAAVSIKDRLTKKDRLKSVALIG